MINFHFDFTTRIIDMKINLYAGTPTNQVPDFLVCHKCGKAILA